MRALFLMLLVACGGEPPPCRVIYPCCNIYGQPVAARCEGTKPLQCEQERPCDGGVE